MEHEIAGIPAVDALGAERVRLAGLLTSPLARSRDPIALLRRFAMSAATAIPGVASVRMDHMPTRQMGIPPNLPANMHLAVRFDGWSPSLHGRPVAINLNCGSGTPGEIARRLGMALCDVLARQSLRARDASAHGIRLPTTGPHLSTRHLHIDAALLAINRQWGVDVEDEVACGIDEIHRRTDRYHGGDRLESGGYHVVETLDRATGGMIRSIGLRTSFLAKGEVRSTQAIFDGWALDVFNMPILPHTVLTSIVGRPLGDLVSLHAALNGRIVRGIRADDHEVGRYTLTFEPDYVPLDAE